MRHLRPTIRVLAALLLALTVAIPGALAQDESMAVAEHPLVGAWIIEPTPDGPQDLLTVAPGGIMIEAGADGTTGYGSWVSTGERNADATFLVAFTDPEAGFLDYAVFRASVEVSEDGQSFSGTYTIEPPAEMAEAFGMPAGEQGPGDVTGQRIAVEPMGETVAPIPSAEEMVLGE
jgi:hypothetical protein